jgi:uncharacterized protein
MTKFLKHAVLWVATIGFVFGYGYLYKLGDDDDIRNKYLIIWTIRDVAEVWFFLKGEVAYEIGDSAKAVRIWTPLAEQGHDYAGLAGHKIGRIYEDGLGVPQNYKEAMKWYRLVAEQGYGDAQQDVGRMYVDGVGVKQDLKEGVKWYRLAAEQGLAEAQYMLGLMYDPELISDRTKAGIKRTMLYRYMWLNIAASNGQEQAAEERDAAAKKTVSTDSRIEAGSLAAMFVDPKLIDFISMTESDILKAQDMSNECVKKNYKGC